MVGNKSKGQALVEFALVAPIVFLVIIGVIEMSRGVYLYNTLANVAREGARAGMVIQDDSVWTVDGNRSGTYATTSPYLGTSTIVGKAAAQAVMLDPAQTTVVISAPMGTTRYLKLPLEVSVSYPFRPVVFQWLPGSPTMTLTARTTMRIE
ncbi:MAG: pilus assembly protein [Chloroflexi bacterium]|nr:pilus assembly protein [Chloroflexota bacterium]